MNIMILSIITLIAPTDHREGLVKITWNVPTKLLSGEKITGLTGYKIMYGAVGEFPKELVVPNPKTTHAHLIIPNEKVHYFYVSAMCDQSRQTLLSGELAEINKEGRKHTVLSFP